MRQSGYVVETQICSLLDLCLDGNCAVVWFADSQENVKSISSDHVGEARRDESQHCRRNG